MERLFFMAALLGSVWGCGDVHYEQPDAGLDAGGDMDLPGDTLRPDRLTWQDSSPGDHLVPDSPIPPEDLDVEGPPAPDLTTPCTAGSCPSGMVCHAAVCRTVCTTSCGDKAPECKGADGCHKVTSSVAVCLPGTAQFGQACGTGIHCVAGNLCVKVSAKPAKCLKLCKYTCPTGTTCTPTSTSCKVCI